MQIPPTSADLRILQKFATAKDEKYVYVLSGTIKRD